MWVCVCVGVCGFCNVCMCGFCNVWVCVYVGFVMCVCVCVGLCDFNNVNIFLYLLLLYHQSYYRL